MTTRNDPFIYRTSQFRPVSTRIDLLREIEDAWSRLWAKNLKDRNAGQDYRGTTYYLTATDIEREVRKSVDERLDTYGARIVGAGRLLDRIRVWLRGQCVRGRLECHNFGRGHISGQRYRPAGQPIGPAEAATIARKKENRPRPIHLSRSTSWNPIPLCTAGRSRSRFSRGRSKTWTTKDVGRVTCTRCQKILQSEAQCVSIEGGQP